jgi:hypothetical protein
VFVFLSYASEHRDVAEEIALALKHEVFFDKDSLPPGREFHGAIRKKVEASDSLIFLISPESVVKPCYALTELKYAREKWPRPQQKVFPVMVEHTKLKCIPPYLRSVTIFEPEGNVAAEVADEFERWVAADIEHVGAPVTPSPPAPERAAGLLEILPGTWQLQVLYPNGMGGQAQAQMFPNGMFQLRGSTAIASFGIEGNWQVIQSNLILLRGQQNVGFQIFPFNVTIQFSEITSSSLVGIMSTGESTTWHKMA